MDMPAYSRLVRVPGYPVSSDPDVDANYFFYDGLYWVLQDGRWYAGRWFNGPWRLVDPSDVPSSCCAFRCAAIAARRYLSMAGAPTVRLIGATLGTILGTPPRPMGALGSSRRAARPPAALQAKSGRPYPRAPQERFRFAPNIIAMIRRSASPDNISSRRAATAGRRSGAVVAATRGPTTRVTTIMATTITATR